MIMQVFLAQDDTGPIKTEADMLRFMAWRPKPPGEREVTVIFVSAGKFTRWGVVLSVSYHRKCHTLQRALELASCFKITQAEVYGVQGDNFEHLYTVTVRPRA